jgi:hypothetical protein
MANYQQVAGFGAARRDSNSRLKSHRKRCQCADSSDFCKQAHGETRACVKPVRATLPHSASLALSLRMKSLVVVGPQAQATTTFCRQNVLSTIYWP